VSDTKQAQKRARAAQVPFNGTTLKETSPAYGPLDVEFASAFDRLTYIVTAENLPTKNAKKYKTLMEYLSAATGCDEEEILAHGNKVRGWLWFAMDSLRNKGTVGKEKIKYPLPPVKPAF
jgi:hypothetical protein